MSSTPPPQPLGYQSAAPQRRRPIVDFSLLISCGFAACLLSMMLLFLVPYVWIAQERTLMDYGVQIPMVTKTLIAFSEFCRSGGIILIWIIFGLPPFVAARTQPWPPLDNRQRIFRPSRLIITLLLAIFCIWIVVGLMLPHVNLLDAISNGPQKTGR